MLLVRNLLVLILFAFKAYCMESANKFNWQELPLDLQKVIMLDVFKDNEITPEDFYYNLLNLRTISRPSDFTKIIQVLKNEIESKRIKNFNNMCVSQSLIYAIKNESAAIAKILISLGADAKVWDPQSQRPIIDWHWDQHSIFYKFLHIYRRQRPAIEQFLVNNGAVENVYYDFNDNQIINSAFDGDIETVRKLIKNGVNIYAVDKRKSWETALIAAACNRHLDVASALLAAGADINAKNNYGITALMYEVWQGRSSTIKNLMSLGADVNLKDNCGKTALMHAIDSYDNIEGVRCLIANGADIEAQDKGGNTAFMIAASKGSLEKVKILIDSGANVNIKNKQGKTALDFALDGPCEIFDYVSVADYLKHITNNYNENKYD